MLLGDTSSDLSAVELYGRVLHMFHVCLCA